MTASEKVRITNPISVGYKEKMFCVSEAPLGEIKDFGEDLHPWDVHHQPGQGPGHSLSCHNLSWQEGGPETPPRESFQAILSYDSLGFALLALQ